MKIAVSAQGDTLEAQTSMVFGRCPFYVLIDTESMSFTPFANPAVNQGSGAGIQAAQFVVQQGAEAVLAANVGPNAYGVLGAANVPCYVVPEGTVREAVEAFIAGRLPSLSNANVAAHSGIGGMLAGGLGAGTGRGGGGMGRGGGGGMGRGGGGGMGRGGGRGR